MDAKQNKQLIMRGYQLFKDKNIKGLLDLYRDDIEWVGAQSDVIPFAGAYHGKDEVAKFFTDLDNAQEAAKFEPRTFIAEDDRVAVTGDATWHVKSTGRDYDNPWVHVFTIRDGKVSRFEHYGNTAAAEEAFRPTQAGGKSKETPMRH